MSHLHWKIWQLLSNRLQTIQLSLGKPFLHEKLFSVFTCSEGKGGGVVKLFSVKHIFLQFRNFPNMSTRRVMPHLCRVYYFRRWCHIWALLCWSFSDNIVYKKKGDLVDIIAERIRCHPKKRREEKREGKRKKTLKKKSANILLSRELDAAL